MMCLGVDFFWLILLVIKLPECVDLHILLNWGNLCYHFFQYFSSSALFLLSLCDPNDTNVSLLLQFRRSLMLFSPPSPSSPHHFHLCSLSCLDPLISIFLFSSSLSLSSIPSTLLVSPAIEIFISVIVFSSSNISTWVFIFSISLLRLFI